MRLQTCATVPALVLAIAAATVATAQTPPPSPRVACRSSAKSLCQPEIAQRDMAGVRACLIKNFDKATPECQAAMKNAQAHGGETPDAVPPKP